MDTTLMNNNLPEKDSAIKPLGACVAETVSRYFEKSAGEKPKDVYNLVLEEVETALYEVTMKFVKGNQSEAARILGVSRGTLRTKLAQYFGTTHIGH